MHTFQATGQLEGYAGERQTFRMKESVTIKVGIGYNTLHFSVLSKTFLELFKGLRQKNSFLKEIFNEQNCTSLDRHGCYFTQS